MPTPSNARVKLETTSNLTSATSQRLNNTKINNDGGTSNPALGNDESPNIILRSQLTPLSSSTPLASTHKYAFANNRKQPHQRALPIVKQVEVVKFV